MFVTSLQEVIVVLNKMASEDSTKGLISTREETHGPFNQQALISQELKDVYYKYQTYFEKDSDPIVDEAIEMILKRLMEYNDSLHFVDYYCLVLQNVSHQFLREEFLNYRIRCLGLIYA